MRWVAAAAFALAAIFVIFTYLIPGLNHESGIWVGGFWEWLRQLVPVRWSGG